MSTHTLSKQEHRVAIADWKNMEVFEVPTFEHGLRKIDDQGKVYQFMGRTPKNVTAREVLLRVL